jgi:UDP-glucuronate decarboxylase
MKRKILVTGGAGNIGGSLARRLVRNPDNFVVIVDSMLTGSAAKLPSRSMPNWLFIRGDVNNRDDIAPVMAAHRFDVVFHYAAVVGVRRTLENPHLVLNDIKGFENILGLAKNTGTRRVFFSSSSEVYGEAIEVPQREDTTPLNSRLPYAIVKNVGEAFFRTYSQEFGLDHTIFRFFNTYGPLQSTDFVVSRFINQALRGEDLTIYGDGGQSRTFCFIDDNLDFTEKVLEEDLWLNETVNVGNDCEVTVAELAEKVLGVTGSKSRIVHLPPLPEGDMSRRCPDVGKMLSTLGRPLVSLEEGIKRTVAAAIGE